MHTGLCGYQTFRSYGKNSYHPYLHQNFDALFGLLFRAVVAIYLCKKMISPTLKSNNLLSMLGDLATRSDVMPKTVPFQIVVTDKFRQPNSMYMSRVQTCQFRWQEAILYILLDPRYGFGIARKLLKSYLKTTCLHSSHIVIWQRIKVGISESI